MDKLFYKPSNAWVGDLIPYWEDGKYYGFYLHDPRIFDKQYAEETTWHLVTTTDFVNLDYKGEAIKRGTNEQPNKNAYTGSIIKDKDGIYHAFYTAFNADIKIEGKSVQTVMQAVGADLEHLETMENFIYVADGKMYEEFDWRDPYVFWNDDDSCYYMLLAARVKNAGERRGGCVALCKSEDLINWSYEEPFYYPKMYITMECPEVFKMGEYWYLVFSTFSDQFTTHYRYSKKLNGPWIIPEDDVFDTRVNYAIKTASDGKKRYAFGWIASKYGSCDFGPWEWGGTMVFHEIIQNEATGELHVEPIEGVKNYYDKKLKDSNPVFYNSNYRVISNQDIELNSETLGAVLYDVPKNCFSIKLELEIESASEFGIALHTDEGLEKGYFLRMKRTTNTVAWDMWPRSEKGLYQWQINGDVPYQIETSRKLPQGNKFNVLIIREDDICVVYINDKIALSTRMYDYEAGKAGFYIVQGQGKIRNYCVCVRDESREG